MMAARKRRIGWRIAPLIGIPLVAVGSYCWFKSVEASRWDEMRRWCEEVATEVSSRDSRKPVLRGVAQDGNAWDDYKVALRTLGFRLNVSPITKVLNREAAADRFAARAFCEQYAPALEALRRGASRSRARRRTDRDDWKPKSEKLGSYINYLALLAACQSRFLVEDGKPREAMELLLDTARYGEDAALNGTWTDGLGGLGQISLAMDELRDLLSSERMSREDYLELARELALLDEGFPREAEGWAAQAMTSGFFYLQKGRVEVVLDECGREGKPTWRYAFSDRLVLTDAFQTERYWDRKLCEAAGKPWPEARQVHQEVAADERGSRNPVLRKVGMWADLLERDQLPRSYFRDYRAQLRLLRSAAAYRATGEFPVLDDPYGDKIHSSISGTHLKLWSVGADGIDDSGTGEWHPRSGADIVLEIER